MYESAFVGEWTLHCKLLFLHGVTLHPTDLGPKNLATKPRTWKFFNGYRLFTPTPRREVLLEKLTFPRLAQKFIAFYGTRTFVTGVTSAATCPYPNPRQSSPCPPNPLLQDPFNTLHSHQRLRFSKWSLPSGFPTKTLYALPSPYVPHAPSISFLILSRLFTLI